jgi:hypothetical protein
MANYPPISRVSFDLLHPIKYNYDLTSQDTYMSVRTTGSTHVTKLQLGDSESEEVSMTTLASWTRSHTAQRHIVDVAFCNEIGLRSIDALAVTDRGQIFNLFADTKQPP